MNIPTPPYPAAPGAPVTGGAGTPGGVLPPLEGAAAVFDRLLPGVPAPGAPGATANGPWDFIPTITVPQIPGLPVPLPTEIGPPSDGICAGTGGLWSASANPGAAPAQAPVTGPATDRRDDWG
ncbi:hypothetical protein [Mycobacterium sp. GA-2829]|uniref:hypothetical protein n=1 Tax=Mycobacterium sp. GA-2829 TaxID=1772283 RepID=UPI001E3E5D1E|nr:hypothetical protein [Mycobacterium sp. GA-2829]